MLFSKAKMWVPVQRSAEDMFVDMGTDVAAAAVDQVAQAVQVQSSSFFLCSTLI